MFSSVGAGDEVELAAGTADMARPGRFGADLTVEVDGDAAVDGNEVVELANRFRIVDVVHRRRQDILVVIQEVVQFLRTHADGEDTFAPM